MFSFNNISEFLDELSDIESGVQTALESNETLCDRIPKCKDLVPPIKHVMLKNVSTISRDIKILLRIVDLLAEEAQRYNLYDPFPDTLDEGLKDYYEEVKKYNSNWQRFIIELVCIWFYTSCHIYIFLFLFYVWLF